MNTKPDDRQHDAAQDIINNFDFMKVIDWSTDPFGIDFAWLNPQETPIVQAYSGLAGYSPSRWHITSGPALRRIVQGDSLSSGTDQGITESWARDRFPQICKKGGEEGVTLLHDIRKYGNHTEAAIRDIVLFLEQQPETSPLSTKELSALAFVVVAIQGPRTKTQSAT